MVKYFSFGNTKPFLISRRTLSAEQRTKGLPSSTFKNNTDDIAVINYLNPVKEDGLLLGFLSLPQAMRIIEEKDGDTYWNILISFPTKDFLHDILLLKELLEYHKHETIPNVYRFDYGGLYNLFDWIYSAYLEFGTESMPMKKRIAELETELKDARSHLRMLSLSENNANREMIDLEQRNIELLTENKKLRKQLENNEKPELSGREGHVYLLKMVNGAYWKIGRAINPNDRLRVFNVKLPFAVEFEHLIPTPDMFQLERELHLKFAAKRSSGEWFALSQEDIDYIKSL